MPFWNNLSEKQQELLLAAESPQETFTLIGAYESELPILFTAAVLNVLKDSGLEDIVPRFMVSLENRERVLEISAERVNLYLLQNRIQEAGKLADMLFAFFPAYSNSTDLVEISLLLGYTSQARSSLNTYLRNNIRQEPAEYVKSLFLLARIFIAEENVIAARTLLLDYFQADRLPADSSGVDSDVDPRIDSLYYVQSAQLLYDLLQSNGEYSADNDLLKKLEKILTGVQLPAHSVSAYPDIRLFDTSVNSLPDDN